jgi:glycosyltransferase involved in cell wall biosynthesis
MKIVLVRSRAIDQAVNKLAEALGRGGHSVTLLVWDRSGDTDFESRDNCSVRKFSLGAPHDTPLVLLYLPLWWLYEFVFLLRSDCEVIHACDLDTLIMAIPVKLIRKVKLNYSIFDFYANNLPSGSFSILRRWIRGSIESMEKWGIGFTNVLFLADESRLQEIEGAKARQVVFIYNSPPDRMAKADRARSSRSDFVRVFYAGILVKSRGIDHMIAAVGPLEGVELVIGGTGPESDKIRNVAQQSKNIQYLGWIPSYEEVIKHTMNADILFRFSSPDLPKTKYESPNKLFEAMMCGKPVIVTDGSSMSEIVRRENCGIVVKYGDLREIREAVEMLKSDHTLRETLGRNGRIAYERKYGWGIMEKRLIMAYE